MPLQDYMKIISVDDHLIEPPDLWQRYLPEKHKALGPKIVEADGGVDVFGNRQAATEVWEWEGRTYTQAALNAIAGRPIEEYGLEPERFEDVRPGCYNPVERLKDMDTGGIWASLNFPTFPRFAGTRFLEGNDKDLALACVQAYNDYMLDEWCATAPNRFIPMIILPLWDAELAAAEIRRTGEKGAKAISFPENPVPLGLPSWYTDGWDPVFTAVQDYDLTLCMHFGTSGFPPKTSDDAPLAVSLSIYPTRLMATAADLIMSPVFRKFDKLRVCLSEGGIGWIPFMLERMDLVHAKHRYHAFLVNDDVRPSDVFRKHIFGCFIDEPFGVKNLDDIGADNVMYECDFPHSDSTWPSSRTKLADQLKDIPDETVHKIVQLNAERVFNFTS